MPFGISLFIDILIKKVQCQFCRNDDCSDWGNPVEKNESKHFFVSPLFFIYIFIIILFFNKSSD